MIIFILFFLLNLIYLKSLKKTKSKPSVSIIIPARNEEKNLEKLIPKLKKQDYPDYEIILVDDLSSDNTKKFQNQVDKYILNKKLPLGWSGKNWACYNGSKLSEKDYICFIDADTRVKRNFLKKHMSYTQSYDMYSVHPLQVTKSFNEKVTVPLMAWSILTLIPFYAFKLPFKSLALAVGQCMFFKREFYMRIRGHKTIKSILLDDVSLAQLTKKNKGKLGINFSQGEILCRMYSEKENPYYGLARSLSQTRLINLFYLVIYITLVSLTTPYSLMIFYILVIITNIISTGKFNKYFLFYPISIIKIIFIAIKQKKGGLTWKGRTY